METQIQQVQKLISQRAFEKAQKLLDTILKDSPENAETLSLKAICLMEQGELEEAEQIARLAIEKNFDLGLTHRTLAKVQLRQKNYLEAEKTARQAIIVAPLNPEGMTIFGQLKAQQSNDWTTALDWAMRGLQTEEDHLPSLLLKTESLLNLKRLDEAQSTLDQLKATGSTIIELSLLEADLLDRQGKPKEASKRYQEILQKEPNNIKAQEGLKEALNKAPLFFRWWVKIFG